MPGVHVAAGLLVVLVLRDHRADRRAISSACLPSSGSSSDSSMPDCAVPLELERAAEPGAGLLRVHVVDEAGAGLLAVPLVQLRLGIEQVHLAGAAVLEEVDDALRASGPEVRRAWTGRSYRAPACALPSASCACSASRAGQRQRPAPIAEPREELPPREKASSCGRELVHVRSSSLAVSAWLVSVQLSIYVDELIRAQQRLAQVGVRLLLIAASRASCLPGSTEPPALQETRGLHACSVASGKRQKASPYARSTVSRIAGAVPPAGGCSLHDAAARSARPARGRRCCSSGRAPASRWWR